MTEIFPLDDGSILYIAEASAQGPTGPPSTVPGPAGRGVVSVVRTSGTGAAGTTDTYTVTFTDATTSTFDVVNGANGTNGTNGAPGGSDAATAGWIDTGPLTGAALDSYVAPFADRANHTGTQLAATVSDFNSVAVTATAAADLVVQTVAEAQGTISLNPSFTKWAGAVPDNWDIFNGTPTKETVLVRTSPNAVRFACADATTQKGLAATSASGKALNTLPIGLQYVTVDIEVYLVSGTSFGGSGVWLDWTGMSTAITVTLNLSAEIPAPVTGKWYRVSKVFARPAAATGTQTSWSAWILGQYATNMGTQAVKDVIFNRVGYRSSTTEEISAYLAAPKTYVDTADTAAKARANHTGTQSADTLTDGTTNKAFLATERTKLSTAVISAEIVTIKQITQAAYTALGGGVSSTTLYLIVG